MRAWRRALRSCSAWNAAGTPGPGTDETDDIHPPPCTLWAAAAPAHAGGAGAAPGAGRQVSRQGIFLDGRRRPRVNQSRPGRSPGVLCRGPPMKRRSALLFLTAVGALVALAALSEQKKPRLLLLDWAGRGKA